MSNETPGVDRAYRALREMFRSGNYREGARLPGERVLAHEVGVSRATMRAALGRLADEGVVASSYKRGWFVPRQALAEPPNILQSFTEMARARGLTAQTRVLGITTRSCTFDEADELGIAPSADVLVLERLRELDDVPICLDRTILPRSLMAGVDEDSFVDASLYEIVEQRLGLSIHRSSYTVRADLVDEETSQILGVAVGSPALKAHERTYLDDGRVLLLGDLIYRGDAYRFEADLYRP